jgi:hypothetical protein
MPDAGARALPAISIVRDEKAARTEEDKMYPHISQALADERVKDRHIDATRAQRARQFRLIRRARKAAIADIRIPDSYDDFLCQTAEAAVREPTAAGRIHGRAVR